ncbi:phosphotransferase enzyme family protein [Ceratobasidium sp. AG-Ba]|nr:phosphotransferase enzyme family protein [Ceratobasidium sp. AG-Ba]
MPSVKDFHDLFVKLPHAHEWKVGDPLPFRQMFPDDVPIVFTHGDMHRGNILVLRASDETGFRVASIIDWGQGGWMPSYWEYCKARWSAHRGEEWEADYIPLFLDRHDVFDYWDYFILSMGM